MVRHRFRSALRLASIATVAGLWGASNVAHADSRFDLRATSVNGVPLSGVQSPRAIPNALVGDVIRFDVFVTVRGTDANFSNDRFVSGIGSFRSVAVSAQNLRGNLLMDIVRTTTDPDTGEPIAPFGFDANASSVGLQQDLDGDGDIDVGSNIDSQAANHWAVRYFGAPLSAPAGLPNGARVGFGTFTVTSGAAGAQTLLQFIGRNSIFGQTWDEDGVRLGDVTEDSLPGESILVTAVPEPSTFASLFGAASIFQLRRRKRRSNPLVARRVR